MSAFLFLFHLLTLVGANKLFDGTHNYGGVIENALAAACTDGCITDQKASILTLSELLAEQEVLDDGSADTNGFDSTTINFIKNNVLYKPLFDDDMFLGDDGNLDPMFSSYLTLVTSTTYTVASADSSTCAVDMATSYTVSGFETAMYTDDDICYENQGPVEKVTYVPRHDAAMTDAEFSSGAYVAGRTEPAYLGSQKSPFNRFSVTGSFTQIDGVSVSAQATTNGACADSTAWDCGSVDSCSGTSEKQYRAHCKPFRLVSDDWTLTSVRGFPYQGRYHSNSGVPSVNSPFVLHDCTGENIIGGRHPTENKAQCLYPAPGATAAENVIKIKVNGGVEEAIDQQDVLWGFPVMNPPQIPPGVTTITVFRATAIADWKLLFGKLQPPYADIAWDVPSTSKSLGYYSHGNALIHAGCSENVNGSPSETGQCTYNIGLLIRDHFAAQSVKASSVDPEQHTEVMDQAEQFTQVQPYVLTFAKDPATLELTTATAVASGTVQDVYPGMLRCDYINSKDYLQQELTFHSSIPGVFQVMQVSYENHGAGVPSDKKYVVLQRDENACNAVGSFVYSGTTDACTKGTVLISGSEGQTHQAIVRLAVSAVSGCSDDKYTTSNAAMSCETLISNFQDYIQNNPPAAGDIRFVVTGMFYALQDGSSITDVQEVEYDPVTDVITANDSNGDAIRTFTLQDTTSSFVEKVADNSVNTIFSTYDPEEVIQAFDADVCTTECATCNTEKTFSGSTPCVSLGVSTAYTLDGNYMLSNDLFYKPCVQASSGETTCAAMQADQHVEDDEYHMSLLNFIRQTGATVFEPDASHKIFPAGAGAGVVLMSTFFGPQSQPDGAIEAQTSHLTVPLFTELAWSCSAGGSGSIPIFGGVDDTGSWHVNSDEFWEDVLSLSQGQRQVIADWVQAKYQDGEDFSAMTVADPTTVKLGHTSGTYNGLQGPSNGQVAVSATRYADNLFDHCPSGSSSEEQAVARKRFTALPEFQGTATDSRCDTNDSGGGGGGVRRLGEGANIGTWTVSGCATDRAADDVRGHVSYNPMIASTYLDHGNNCNTGPAITLVVNDQEGVQFASSETGASNTYGYGDFSGSGPCDFESSAQGTCAGTADTTESKGYGQVFDPVEILKSSPKFPGTTSAWDQWKAELTFGSSTEPSVMSYVGLMINTAYLDQCPSGSDGTTTWTTRTKFLHVPASFVQLSRRLQSGDVEDLLDSTTISTSEATLTTTVEQQDQQDTVGVFNDTNATLIGSISSASAAQCIDSVLGGSDKTVFDHTCVCESYTNAEKDSVCSVFTGATLAPPPPPPPPPPPTEKSNSATVWIVSIAILIVVVAVLRMLTEERKDVRAIKEKLIDTTGA